MPATPGRARSSSLRLAVLFGVVCVGCTGDQVAAMLPVEAYRNVGSSMVPTIPAGAKFAALRFGDSVDVVLDARRGDVVVHQVPTDTADRYVKRIVGMPGDTIAMREGVVYVNGVVHAEPYAHHSPDAVDHALPEFAWQRPYRLPQGAGVYRPTQFAWGPLVIPPGAYLLLGDNRDNSLDSRYYGFVAAKHIRARIPSKVLDQLATRSRDAH